MKKLVLIRHGQSNLNLKKAFGGWLDVDLSNKGREEAVNSAKLLSSFNFDVVHTSALKRSIKTANIILEQLNCLWVPVYSSWRLNERHYGALQGMVKREAAVKYGEAQLQTWRRSFSEAPPPLDGKSESLSDVTDRLRPYWEDCIARDIYNNKCVLVVGHSNSLRALLHIIKKMSEEQLINLNIPTATPLVIEFNNHGYQSDYYLGDQEVIKRRIDEVAKQGTLKKK